MTSDSARAHSPGFGLAHPTYAAYASRKERNSCCLPRLAAGHLTAVFVCVCVCVCVGIVGIAQPFFPALTWLLSCVRMHLQGERD